MNHPALESFGDLDAAARDPHVAACPDCQRDLQTQVQVRTLLASLPDPGPTPPDVVDRLEATLRRLSAETSAGHPEQSAAASTVVPLAPARERRHRGWLAVAAAVVLLGAGGATLSQLVPDGGRADSTAAGAALNGTAEKRVAPDAGLQATASGTDYTADRLATQVDQVLASRPSSAAAAPSGPLATPAGVAACLAAIGAPRATPLLVDVARYQGSPAAVVVVPASGGGREIWVVSTTCSPGKDGTRYFTRTR
ncbi:hypothetical protein [Angustibacter sp. Root456]|uniref:hypothetical protein n=1 Tax=Angustibacter sp. Root456 TaxID=1736539 RepID=UPI0006F6D61D|nr:hypothetical protein [Angustibacter sp. Root456]KQX61871.1 hypothetical protein ASD06_15075 [Angustibacter sp. Root456]